MKTVITTLTAILLVLGVGCDAYLALPDDVQQKVVTSKTVEAWQNKGNSQLLVNLANELASLPEGERAQAATWAGNVWKFLDAVQASQRAVAAAAPAGDCYAAARKHFPQSQWNQAYKIIRRESGGSPSAKNPRSTASGCFQILSGSWQHPSVSFSAGRFNADHNARAARALWDSAGRRWNCTCTWALTA